MNISPLVLPLVLLSLASCAVAPSTAPVTSETPSAASPSATPSSLTPSAPSGITCDYRPFGTPARTVDPPPSTGVANSGTVSYTLKMAAGDVSLTLDRAAAPCTVNSFEALAAQGYFDKTTCHRVTDDGGLFVLQCGDPSGSGSGGPGYQFDDELAKTTGYPAGTVAMANAGPDTNGSQFFLVYADSQLSPDYTVFGHTDAAGIGVVAGVAAKGNDGSYGTAGGGKPLGQAAINAVVAE